MIPDVHANAANLSLRYVDLNRQINSDYAWFGGAFQAIIDPAFADSAVSDAYPNWFAFASFASRGIGQAQLGADIALDAARFYHETGDHAGALARVSPNLANVAAGLVERLMFGEARLAATFLVAFFSAWRHHGGFEGFAYPAMLDPRTLLVSVERLVVLMAEAPGAGPIERLGCVSSTLRNTMTDGNRRIYADICGAGQDYLTARDGGQAARNDGLPYDFALQHLDDAPLPTDFGHLFPELAEDARPLMAAAFALFELAGRTGDLAVKNRLVAFANNYLAYREQRDAVQLAFNPGQVLPGEVDRPKVMAIITPGVEVVLRSETWKVWEYAAVRHSHVTDLNWGRFEDRWMPIIDSFGPCYKNPQAMWPPPNPDPNQPI